MYSKQQRIVYLDNIRSTMIILVVIMHTAVTYSGLGSWYYVENPKVDFLSLVFFAFIQMYMQAFFMGLLFMISGYFTAASLHKRGTWDFIKSRLIRLGIPTVFYMLFIHCLNLVLIYPDINIIGHFIRGVKSLRIISWNGPMWFAAALLLFSLIYAGFKKLSFRTSRFTPGYSWKSILALIFVIAALAFILRIFFPLGSSVVNFQLGFFSSYIILFSFGIFAYPAGFFDSIDGRVGKKYLLFSLTVSIPLWCLLMFFGGPTKGVIRFYGGWHWQAAAWALLESYICVTFCFALVGLFRARFNSPGKLGTFLSSHSFAVYVFHPPVLIGVSMVLKKLILPPIGKFFLVFLISVPLCFLTAWLIRKIPQARKIFS